jgi:prepilin-type N-terminal cleavage/methylation domain-containing protein
MQNIPRPRRPGCQAAFTLVELLVVLAIIATLTAILFPVLAAVRANARRTVCISQLRQNGLALAMYSQDYGDFPARLSLLHPAYVTDTHLFRCPADPKQAQYLGNERLEGTLFLPSGVNYTYVPRWREAVMLGWWLPGPSFGTGKWDDLTPLLICDWHWARKFYPDWTQNTEKARGWQMILTAGGSVRKRRVEEPLEQFTPDFYR